MSEPFLGEIKPFAFSYAPKFWARCDGQTLSIQQNLALFDVLRTTYGGNGSTTFALPNLQGSVPIHRGGSRTLGQSGGSEGVSLIVSNLPSHSHVANASSVDADSPVPTDSLLGSVSETYTKATGNLKALTAGTIGMAGSGQPHENLQPYLVLNYCIALAGIFPSRPHADEEA
jgi:microcystin-dependent protein